MAFARTARPPACARSPGRRVLAVERADPDGARGRYQLRIHELRDVADTRHPLCRMGERDQPVGLAAAEGGIEPEDGGSLAARAAQAGEHVVEQVAEAARGIGVGEERRCLQVVLPGTAPEHLAQVGAKSASVIASRRTSSRGTRRSKIIGMVMGRDQLTCLCYVSTDPYRASRDYSPRTPGAPEHGTAGRPGTNAPSPCRGRSSSTTTNREMLQNVSGLAAVENWCDPGPTVLDFPHQKRARSACFAG